MGPQPPQKNVPALVTACCLISGIAGGVIVWIGQKASFSVKPVGMSYPDLAATLLTAASLLIAIFGAILALVAIWGYTQFKRGVEKRTKAAVNAVIREHLIAELQQGPTRNTLEEIVARFISSSKAKPGVVEAWTKELDREKSELEDLDADDVS